MAVYPYLFPMAFAEEDKRPKWISKIPRSSKGKYYVGRAFNVKTEKLGIEIASRDAWEQAIRENFGFRTRISKRTTETLKEIKYKKSLEELSKDVQIIGFEQSNMYFEKARKGNKLNVWVLFKYPIEEISKEKKRLKKISFGRKKTAFSVQGNKKDLAKGTLEVVTTPEDAVVYIDGEPWGRTPLRLIGKLSEGKHTLELKKASYKGVKRSILIFSHRTERINEKLTRGVGKIQIVSDPHNANIAINGKRIGLSPTEFIEFESGIPLKVELTHAEAHPKTFTTELDIDEKKVQNIDLEYRPSYLRLFVTPKDAEIILNDEVNSHDELKNKRISSNKKYFLNIQKEGYKTHEEIVLLKGGEKKSLSVNLKKDTDYITHEKISDEDSKSEEFERGRLAQYLLVYYSKGLGSLKVDSWGVAYNPMFVYNSGNIFGLKLKAESLSSNDGMNKFKAGKLGIHLSYHPQAVEIYTSDSPPQLLPLTGIYLGGGGGIVSGYVERISDGRSLNLKTPSFSFEVGYDWEEFYLSLAKNFYVLLPENSLNFKLPSDLAVSFGFRMYL